MLTCMICLLVSLLLADRSYADTIVAGRIVDQTTESGVGGTGIRVTSGGRTLGEAVTKNNGKFTVSFDIGSSRDVKNVTLLIEHEDFEKQSLLPASASVCLRVHTIVLMNHRPHRTWR